MKGEKYNGFFILIRKTHVLAHLFKNGFGKYATNIKLESECEECNRTGQYKCKICQKYHGHYHVGFSHATEIKDEVERFYDERKARNERES